MDSLDLNSIKSNSISDDEKYSLLYDYLLIDVFSERLSYEEEKEIFKQCMYLYKDKKLTKAAVLLSHCYKLGVGVKEDLEKAFKLACFSYYFANNQDSIAQLANLIFTFKGCFKNFDKSDGFYLLKIMGETGLVAAKCLCKNQSLDYEEVVESINNAYKDEKEFDKRVYNEIRDIVVKKDANVIYDKTSLDKLVVSALGENANKINNENIKQEQKDNIKQSTNNGQANTSNVQNNNQKINNDNIQNATSQSNIQEKKEKENKGKVVRKAIIKQGDKVSPYNIEKDELYISLTNKIKGQDEAIKQIIINKRMAQLGWPTTIGPKEKYFFYGYTGTGKTALATALAEAEYGNKPNNILVLSMENYVTESSLSRLIGSSQGYADSEKGGILSNALSVDPEIVVIFDEIEKANDKVIQSLLGMLDRGVLYDGFGNPHDATKTTVIFTSNVGTKEIRENNIQSGSEEEKQVFKKALQERFSPEFLGRIPTQVMFGRLSKEALKDILVNIVNTMNENNSRGIVLTLKESAIEQMLNEPEVLDKNVRGLKENIKNKLLKDITLEADVKKQNIEYEVYYENGRYKYNTYEIRFEEERQK